MILAALNTRARSLWGDTCGDGGCNAITLRLVKAHTCYDETAIQLAVLDDDAESAVLVPFAKQKT